MKMLLIKTGTHKVLVRIANGEDPDQTASSEAVWSVKKQSDLGLPCLSKPLSLQLVFEILNYLPYIAENNWF